MIKKRAYIFAIILPFVIIWPISVILLPQTKAKVQVCLIAIAVGLLLACCLRNQISPKRRKIGRVFSIAVMASIFLFWTIDAQVQWLVPTIRFHLMEEQYQAEADRISAALPEVPEQYFYKTESEETSHLLAKDGAIYRDKSGMKTLLIFNTEQTFFTFYGYLYLTEAVPHDQVGEEYDFVIWLNDRWAFVKVY